MKTAAQLALRRVATGAIGGLSGSRLIEDLMPRRLVGYGQETMCIGGSPGSAAIFEGA